MKRLIKKAENTLDQEYKSKGFEVINTGGHCLAYYFEENDRSYYLVTSSDGISLPKEADEKVILGHFDEEGIDIPEDSKSFSSSAEFFKFWDKS